MCACVCMRLCVHASVWVWGGGLCACGCVCVCARARARVCVCVCPSVFVSGLPCVLHAFFFFSVLCNVFALLSQLILRLKTRLTDLEEERDQLLYKLEERRTTDSTICKGTGDTPLRRRGSLRFDKEQAESQLSGLGRSSSNLVKDKEKDSSSLREVCVVVLTRCVSVDRVL